GAHAGVICCATTHPGSRRRERVIAGKSRSKHTFSVAPQEADVARGAVGYPHGSGRCGRTRAGTMGKWALLLAPTPKRTTRTRTRRPAPPQHPLYGTTKNM